MVLTIFYEDVLLPQAEKKKSTMVKSSGSS